MTAARSASTPPANMAYAVVTDPLGAGERINVGTYATQAEAERAAADHAPADRIATVYDVRTRLIVASYIDGRACPISPGYPVDL